MGQPAVSVVIPVYNEGPRLYLTLEAMRWSTDVPHEIIVVDDGSTDGTVSSLLQNLPLFDSLRVIQERRSGPAVARNRGAAVATGEVLVFLDAHTFPHRGWLESLLSVLERHPDAAVTPTIAVAGHAESKAYGLHFRDDLSLASLSQRPTGLSEVPLAAGCCLAMPAVTFRELGGFDRMYGLEDIELCLRWWLCGHPVMIEPSAEVAHVIKRHPLDEIALESHLYSCLRMGLVHLDPLTNRRMLARYSHLAAYRRALTRLMSDDFWNWSDFVSGIKRRDFSWFADKFGVRA